MMLNTVCVLTIKVNNIDKAEDFYTSILDFQVSKRYGETIVSLVHQSIPIILEETDGSITESNTGVILGLQSSNIQEDFKAKKAKGVKLLFDEPKPFPAGLYFAIEDPFGNQVEVLEFSNE